jgi:CheY-like chemotaxis protein
VKDQSVLIDDDEKNILLTMLRSLRSLQFKIDTATNGEEALAKLKEKE